MAALIAKEVGKSVGKALNNAFDGDDHRDITVMFLPFFRPSLQRLFLPSFIAFVIPFKLAFL